jgi:hypothetical protein
MLGETDRKVMGPIRGSGEWVWALVQVWVRVWVGVWVGVGVWVWVWVWVWAGE